MKNRSLVIGTPVFNESEGILTYLAEIDRFAKLISDRFPGMSVRVLFADDGSSDDTVAKIQSYVPQNLLEVRLVSLSRNFGPYPAITTIFDHFDGDGLMIMDADLQDSLEASVKLVEYWQQGYENIRVVRKKRAEGFIHQIMSGGFYYVFGKMTGLRSGLGTFGLYDKKVVDAFNTFSERTRYVPGLITLVGFKSVYVEADRDKRAAGTSRVGFKKLVSFALMAIFSFSNMPIYFITALGVIIATVACLTIPFLFVLRLVLNKYIYVPMGWTSVLCSIFFMCGLILVSLGMLGQYISIIFSEVKLRPNYIVDPSRTFRTVRK